MMKHTHRCERLASTVLTYIDAWMRTCIDTQHRGSHRLRLWERARTLARSLAADTCIDHIEAVTHARTRARTYSYMHARTHARIRTCTHAGSITSTPAAAASPLRTHARKRERRDGCLFGAHAVCVSTFVQQRHVGCRDETADNDAVAAATGVKRTRWKRCRVT